MDILIVTASTEEQVEFWQRRLADHPAKVVVVHEDWEGGAGNGLGTLYAYLKARSKAQDLYGVDIQEEQRSGASLALYHTAGQGKRLAPLTCSEHFNKAAVKLPALLDGRPITLLEAVIKQTAPYASSRAGRLSVFWGDQIFLLSNSYDYTPKHHIDILVQLRPLPSETVWNEESLDKYGWVAVDSHGEAKNLEKSSYDTLQTCIKQKKVEIEGGLGVSLGSFSLSYPITMALLDLFRQELHERSIKMDVDVDFWMAMVLDKETFIKTKDAPSHYERMQTFKKQFCKQNPELGFLGAVDIGAESFWWDYGTLANYHSNGLKLLQQNREGEAMRDFFGVTSPVMQSEIGSGTVVNSVLVNVKADHLDVRNCVIIDTTVQSLIAEQALVYHVQEDQPLKLSSHDVRADVNGLKLYTTLDRDGKADWSEKLPGNLMSYAEVFDL